MMAHTNGIRVGKCDAQFASHLGMVLAHAVGFATNVLGGHANFGKNVTRNSVLDRLLKHRQSIRYRLKESGVIASLARFVAARLRLGPNI